MAKTMQEQCKQNSVKMPDGGDTHVHTNPDKTVTISERTREYEQHWTYDQNGNLVR